MKISPRLIPQQQEIEEFSKEIPQNKLLSDLNLSNENNFTIEIDPQFENIGFYYGDINLQNYMKYFF